RIHPRLHVARRRAAGHCRGHQHPEQAGEDGLLGNGEWGNGDATSQLIGDDKEDREIQPSADAVRLVHELKSKDLGKLHRSTRMILSSLTTGRWTRLALSEPERVEGR